LPDPIKRAVERKKVAELDRALSTLSTVDKAFEIFDILDSIDTRVTLHYEEVVEPYMSGIPDITYLLKVSRIRDTPFLGSHGEILDYSERVYFHGKQAAGLRNEFSARMDQENLVPKKSNCTLVSDGQDGEYRQERTLYSYHWIPKKYLTRIDKAQRP
jgi:hypothetical protein